MKRAKRINIFFFIFASVLAVIYAFPFLLVLLNSAKEKRAVLNDPLSLPVEWQWENFTDAIKKMGYWQALTNSLIITIISVVAIIITSSMLAYYLSRSKTKFSAITFLVLVASMIVPFQALMIPFVGLFGERGLNLPGNQITIAFFYVGFGVALSTFLYHGFISNIPYELDEAAAIDGASPFKTFRKIIFPMLGPVTATVAIINALWVWNDFLLPSVVLIDSDQKTLPLRTFVFYGKYTSDYGLAMAGLLLSIIPILIFYFLMQKRIISGISAGAVK
ncbi:carbohydrate ABC transporter permease [Aurantimicrobium minutum]|jgi:raffinose/stachyose/melibiose transport system permease protein|uniref:ABC-type transporter, integral membrane subunit n=1 Tax=Aurantimicrobium minutum TaxID=708131 RepID=A0A173LVM6_9MICO|nr:carbohydrate ABC transporter permease [Aurantimicrobium minutum]BAU98898.1 ABC-type transporter, integral membrane subunit [Aurantimicrobium minutum]